MSDNNNDTVIDISGYDAAQPYDDITYSSGIDTITLSPKNYGVGSITLPSTTTVGAGGLTGGYTISGAGTGTAWTKAANYYSTTDTTVEINADGMKIKEGGDITIGDKSLSKAIEKIEERLGILNPNPELEERWDKLKELRKQYIEMEKDLLEKEKIMKILKES
jgi:hypothetical protein